MTKPYSNKALPSGTVLREWRLEEVLGVGGFGIVYKGRGIYFDELVAIKEYFPSAISERDAESTVVPIDSDAEEVHALGLKKFVEEAKLLWNLSTPSRHPNIVSVRSLFEIHGTAYMVMDFEDGVSLTEVLKRGEKFDEAKLREMVLPVASGLERAHRVGVLHRDIKPSNILITDSGQPVLIDFGSARFETEGVTSTTVTFHTPPYAAIEQYVKTYEQGPWTDIYALGVVLYRCITGEKPAEVLERLHGEKEKPLVEGNWPGFSREFLAAVDAAMIIKPSDRPRSLSEWMAMFDGTKAPATVQDDEDEDDEATRIAPMASSLDISPAPPPAPAVTPTEEKEITSVPDDVKDAKFKMAGDTEVAPTLSEKKKKPSTEPDKKQDPASNTAPGKAAAATPAKKKANETAKPKQGEGKGLSKPVIIAGGAGLLLLGGLAWSLSGGGDEKTASAEASAFVEEISYDDGFGPALMKLAELAQKNGISAKLASTLKSSAESISSLEKQNLSLSGDETRKQDISFNRLKIADTTLSSLTQFADGLSQELSGETRRLTSAAPWANPGKANAAAKEKAELKAQAAAVKDSHGKAHQLIEDLKSAETAETALPIAQNAILSFAAFREQAAQAIKMNPSKVEAEAVTTAEVVESSPAAAPAKAPAPSGKTVAQISAELGQISNSTKDRADDVIKLAKAREPKRDASEDVQQAYRTLQSNANAARNYKSYLDQLTSSMRGANSPEAAEQLLLKGLQTQQYVNNMLSSSRASRAILDR